ncbi:MAG: mechanosensitive ion channel domain-containing protein [Pseudomonadota bacterium]
MPSYPHRWLPGLLLTIVTLAWWPPTVAQTAIPATPADRSVSIEQLETSITAIEAQEGLSEESRTRIIDLLRDAQAQIQNREAAEAAARSFADQIQTSPQETEAVRAELDREPAQPPTDQSLGINDSMRLADVEQALAKESAALTAADSRLSELESQIQSEEARPEQARARIAELRASREQLARQIDAPAPANEPAVLTDARRLAATLRRDAQSAETERLEQELLSHSVRLTLLKSQRDLAERTLAEQRQRVAIYQAAVNSRRQSSAILAQQQATLTGLKSADAHPTVRQFAERNVELARELPDIARDIERATAATAEIEEQARQLEEGFSRSRQRLDIGGVNQLIGRLFFEERRNLPRVAQYRSEVRTRRDALASIGLAQLRIDEQRRDLTPMSGRVDEAMQAIAADVTDPDELASIEDDVRELLSNRRTLLQQAAGTYTSYIRALGDLDIAQRRLLEAADEYKDFLDQNLLWIPSTTPVNLDTLRNIVPAANWALSPASWLSVFTAFAASVADTPLLATFAFMLIAVSFIALAPLKRRYMLLNERVGRLSTDSIWLTIGSIGIILLRASPIPLTLLVAGEAIRTSPEQSDFIVGVGTALSVIAPFLYNVTLYRILCAKRGVAERHFDWPTRSLEIVRRQLGRLAIVGTPLIFVLALVYASPVPAYRDSLARIAFVALMILLSVTVAALIPRSNKRASNQDPDSTAASPRRGLNKLWMILGAGSPLVLGALALIGFLYTATTLTGRLVDTFWLVLGLVVTNLVVLRWLSLAQRKILLQQALERRRQRQEAETAAEDEESEGELPKIESKPMDLDVVDQQSRALLRASLVFVGALSIWGIWSEVLPALSVLEQVSLWSQTVMVDGQETIAPVTLADLLLAVFIAFVTFIASRNLPGLMEIAILQRLSLQAGSRYAINTMVRYIVVTVGAISVLGIIGWDWSQIQWLVAALTVGLGFGLQEIVANFISGVIILFERPVRVGDTVTVGQVTGTVSRLRIRATTITDWDRKEIVVPNKSFITEQVINWTLSDPITRIVVDVGISYGSDVTLAHKVMQKTLDEMPLILDDPEPRVYFIGFGDSSLNFKLYVYSRQLADRLPLIHAVHEQILTALRKNDIEIPFPQRDLHVRSIDRDIPLPGRGEDDA